MKITEVQIPHSHTHPSVSLPNAIFFFFCLAFTYSNLELGRVSGAKTTSPQFFFSPPQFVKCEKLPCFLPSPISRQSTGSRLRSLAPLHRLEKLRPQLGQ